MNILKPVSRFLKKNGPLLLTIGSCAGVVASNVLTAKAVLKADNILDGIRDANTRKDVIKAYIPPVAVSGATIAMIIGAHMMNKRIQAGLIAAYGLLDATFKAYRAQQEPDIDVITMRDIRKDAVENQLPEIMEKCPGEGYILWKDDFRKRPFWARETDILKGVNFINKCLLDPNSGHWCVGLDEFYSGFTKGEDEPQDALYGWTTDYMWEQWDCNLIEVDWTEDGTYTNPESGTTHPCRYLYWWCEPMLNYRSYDPASYESNYEDVYKGKVA